MLILIIGEELLFFNQGSLYFVKVRHVDTTFVTTLPGSSQYFKGDVLCQHLIIVCSSNGYEHDVLLHY